MITVCGNSGLRYWLSWLNGSGYTLQLTDEAQLGELQDHPVLQGLLESKVLHGGEVVWTGHDVVLQLGGRTHRRRWGEERRGREEWRN